MRSTRTCYDVLGVRPQASTEEIRSAYRRLMRAVHPDVGGTAALFDEVQHAYEILNSPSRRRAYDAELTAAPGPRQPLVQPGWPGHFTPPQAPDPWWRRLSRPRAYAAVGTFVMIVGAAVGFAVMAMGRDKPGGGTSDQTAAVSTPQPSATRLRAGSPVNVRGRVLTVTADRATFRLQPDTGSAIVVRVTDRTRFGTEARPAARTSVAPGTNVRVIAGRADGYVLAWQVIPATPWRGQDRTGSPGTAAPRTPAVRPATP